MTSTKDGALSVAGVESWLMLAVRVDNKRIERPLRRLQVRIPALRVTADLGRCEPVPESGVFNDSLDFKDRRVTVYSAAERHALAHELCTTAMPSAVAIPEQRVLPDS
jgi:hypothetical protein